MTRSIATWTGIAAICLAILLVPIWNGALKAAEDTGPHWPTFPSFGGHLPANDKDCIADFNSRQQAQRFLLEQRGPMRDPHRLDRDGDGKACEDVDY